MSTADKPVAPRKPRVRRRKTVSAGDTPLDYMLKVMRDDEADQKRRVLPGDHGNFLPEERVPNQGGGQDMLTGRDGQLEMPDGIGFDRELRVVDRDDDIGQRLSRSRIDDRAAEDRGLRCCRGAEDRDEENSQSWTNHAAALLV